MSSRYAMFPILGIAVNVGNRCLPETCCFRDRETLGSSLPIRGTFLALRPAPLPKPSKSSKLENKPTKPSRRKQPDTRPSSKPTVPGSSPGGGASRTRLTIESLARFYGLSRLVGTTASPKPTSTCMRSTIPERSPVNESRTPCRVDATGEGNVDRSGNLDQSASLNGAEWERSAANSPVGTITAPKTGTPSPHLAHPPRHSGVRPPGSRRTHRRSHLQPAQSPSPARRSRLLR